MSYTHRSSPSPEHAELYELYTWLTQQLASANNDIVDIAVQELGSLLRVSKYRIPFWNTPNAVKK